MTRTLDALFYPYTICLEPTTLKCMLLLYDRIFYLPNDTSLNEGHESLSKRWSMRDGVLHMWFANPGQTYREMMYASESTAWDDPMKELMDAYDELEEKGICIPLQDKRFQDTSRWHPLVEAVDDDIADSHFVYQATKARNRNVVMPLPEDKFQMKGGGCIIRPFRYKQELGTAEVCSERINTTLLFADTHALVPVSPHEAFVTLLNVKLRRVLERHGEEVGADLPRKKKSRFSMLSWQLLTEVASREAIERRSTKEILWYRSASAEPSQRFRQFMFELEAELTDDPWSEKTREHIDGLIQKRVIPELQRARDEKADTWRKLFGETLTTLVSAKNVAAAATAIPLAMHYIPGMSYLQLLSYGTAGLLAETLPALVAARRDDATYRRNALFFLLNLK